VPLVCTSVRLSLLAVLATSLSLSAQSIATKQRLETGEEIFQAACAGCHAPDGTGQPQHVLGFDPPATFPDFTDCSGSTRESDLQWRSVIHNGGPARAFSPIMPSFGPKENPALDDDQIEKVIRYARSLCTDDKKWPSGQFNFARPMVTEKSFPEDESVYMTTFNLDGTPGVTGNIIMEKRFGAITNIELRFRGAFRAEPTGGWSGAVGDTSLELKRTMFLNNRTGTMVAWGNEITLPTGDSKRGFGSGITKYESFVSLGQVLPRFSYIQTQFGFEGPPFRRHDTLSEFYSRTAIGKAFAGGGGYGRLFNVANEFIAIRYLGPRQTWTLDVIPQLQYTLSKRQHMRLGVGVRIPAINTGTRQTQLITYLLWDMFDGGFFEGWR
jgi:mono/diheme cytochrome c family protein